MKNFVFDLYGTLIKIQTDELSPRFRAKMTVRFSRLCGREVEFWSSYDRAFNQAASDEELDFISVIRQIADEHGALISEREARKFAALFRRKSTRKIGVYKGVKKTLKALRSAGARLYLLSNAQSSFTLREIKRRRLTRYFDGIELSSDYGKKKPSYDFFLYLARKYGLDLAETVYTGNDFSCDILPAKSLGMKAVYVHTDISPAEDNFDEVAKVADFASDNDFFKVGEYLLSCVEKGEFDE